MVFQVNAWNPNVAREVKSPAVEKYLQSLVTMSVSTMKTYRARLYPLIDYTDKVLKAPIDQFIKDIKDEKIDPYDFLSGYATYLKGTKKVSDNFLRDVMTTTRAFLEYSK